MKNLLNLKRTVWKQSIITQLRQSNDGRTTVERRSRLMSIICLFLLLTLGTGQMWGAYYITGSNGNLTGWGTWNNMTESSDGIYWYFQAKSGNCEFKINTVKNYTNALDASARDAGFCDTDLGGNTWGSGTDNINYWYNDGAYYILVYVPNTAVNTTNKAKVCASTFLPDAGYETTGNTMTYYSNKATTDQTTSALDRTDGSTTALGTVTTLYLKGFNSKMWQHGSGNIYGESKQHYYYKIHRSAVVAGSTGFTDAKDVATWSAGSWTWGDFNASKYRYPTYSGSLNENLLSGLGSGNYTMSYYFMQNGSKNFRLPSDGSKFNKLTWTIGVPSVSGGAVTSNGTGTGAEGSPFSVADGNTITFTASGSQASTDANSVLYVKWGGDEYSATTTKTITPTTTKQSMTVKLKYYNSADALSGAETTLTIHYQSTVTPSIAVSSFTQAATPVTTANSGETVTINASRQNAGTANITYAYSTDNSSWTTIGSATSATSQAWTLPAATATTTYYVKASMTYNAVTYSDTKTLIVYGKKTIKVKNTNNWSPFSLYLGAGVITNAYPGNTTNISAIGTSAQWKEVVLYSSTTKYRFTHGESTGTADANRTEEKTYDFFTDGSCYEIASGSGNNLSLTETVNCPVVPTITTTETPSSLTNSSATLRGNISSNGNDAITDYGFYWGTTDECGTKAQIATADKTGVIAETITVTAGTTYYFKAYATNSFGTSYGEVQSFKAPYKVTISNPAIGGTFGTTGVQYVTNTMEVSATAATGYAFGSWTATNATMTGTATSEGVTTATLTPSADNATLTAAFSEITHTVTLANDGHGKVQISGEDAESVSGIGIATASGTITAVPDAGYHFLNWTGVSDGVSFVSGNATSAAITIRATADSKTITANFEADKKIYFDNTYTQWEHVYVYLFNNNSYWTDSRQNGVHPQDNLSTGFAVTEMTKVPGEDNLYEYAYYTSSHNYAFSYVAFSAIDMHTYDVFGKNQHAVYRGDWHANLPVYVATAGYEKVQIDKNDASGGYGLYHSGGYWRAYNPSAGDNVNYYLDVFSGTATYPDGQYFKASGDGSLVAEVQARLTTANSNYLIGVHSDAGGEKDQHYATSTTVTVDNSDSKIKLYKYNSDWNITLKTTSEGIYTFVLSQEDDSLRLAVIYPASVGDYRLKYKYGSPAKYRYSDIIKKKEADAGTAVHTSMYIDPTDATTQLYIERCTGISAGVPTWTEKTTFDNTYLNNNFKQNSVAAKGVYEMDVTIAGTEGNASSLSHITVYTGPFYIKTDCAAGGWADYTKNTMEANTINATAAGYDYYFLKWIDNTKTNVKCVIANDFNNELSDTLKSDAILTRKGKAYQTLPESASVRFSYDSKTNTLKRTYLRGSTLSENFVTLVPNAADYVYSAETSGTDYYSSNPKFADNGNWTYQMDAWVYPGAKGGVQTSYPGEAPTTTETLVPLTNDLMGGTKPDVSPTRYHVRLVYDFKTDYLMAAWLPGGTVDQSIVLNSDFMLVRKGQTSADQISFATGQSITEAKRAYGVFQFSKDDMVGHMDSWDATSYGLCMYYFSFPFDVKVSDIFGVGEMGTDWRIQKYNGAKRAQIGWFAETETFWEDLTADSVMHAYEGYSLLLNRINFNNGSNSVWTNIGDGGSVYLYFPSKDPINTLSSNTVKVKVPSHECKIDRYFTQDLNSDGTPKADARNHKFTDSHWNMVGAPLFENKNADGLEECTIESTSLKYIYAWNSSDNTLSAKALLSGSHTFQSMYAYLVQYSGTITFTGASVPASVAARQKKETKHNIIELELAKGETFAGRTYVELSENAEDGFMLNEDMYMLRNSRTADIYSFAGSYDVAANVMSVNNHMVPVGVNVKSAGTYTFSMPDNFDGTVTLIDNFTQTRTNLAIEDYEVSLPKGEINDRFLLEINIRQVPTAIDGVEGGSLKDGKAHKYIENGIMYILRDGQVYDARGNKVK